MGQFGGGYLDTGGLNPGEGKGTWEDYMRQLMFSNLNNMTDTNSPLYQQYARFLQKTTPGIGTNALLAPLMAGGTGYAGGQAIAQKKMETFGRERQDKINTGVSQFGLQMQDKIQSQLGMLGGSFAKTMDRTAETDQANKTDWASIMKNVASLALAIPTGGASLAGLAIPTGNSNNSGTVGYGRY